VADDLDDLQLIIRAWQVIAPQMAGSVTNMLHLMRLGLNLVDPWDFEP